MRHHFAVGHGNQIRGVSLFAFLTGTLAFEVCGQTNPPPLIPVTEATNYIYQQVVVRDVVVQVKLRSTVALLNLNLEYPASPLTCVIQANHTNRFPNLEGYLGQLVEVCGHITAYQGRPQIILTSTNQIRIIEAATTSWPAPPAAGESHSLPAAVGRPKITPQVEAPARLSSEPRTDLNIWVIPTMLVVIIGMLSALVLLLLRRGNGTSGGAAPPLALPSRTAPSDLSTNPHGQILGEAMMPELLDFAKQRLVQELYGQRHALLETQQLAQKTLEELEGRLVALQLPAPERIQAYEQRIAELEKEVASQGEKMREVTRVTLDLLRRRQLECQRESGMAFNWAGRPARRDN